MAFVVREVYKKEWSSWGEKGVSARRQLVGVYSSALDANRAAVHRFYRSAAELDFPDIDNDDSCDVLCHETGMADHSVLQLEVSHGDEGRHTLTVRASVHALDADKSPMTRGEYEEKREALAKSGLPRGKAGRKRPVDYDDEVRTRELR